MEVIPVLVIKTTTSCHMEALRKNGPHAAKLTLKHVTYKCKTNGAWKVFNNYFVKKIICCSKIQIKIFQKSFKIAEIDNVCGGSPTPAPPSPTPTPPAPTPPPSGCTESCGSPQWKGDDWCDDENNNCGCEWDGGDCWGDDVKTQYCKECQCLDPKENTTTEAPCKDSCGSPQWKGDDWCDDENNNCGCEWDGGDCCGDNVRTQYCKECLCLDPKESAAGR